MRTRVTSAVVLGVLAFALCVAPVAASTPSVGMPLACGGAPPFAAHPKEFAFSCDGNVVFTNVRWTKWGAPVAHGTATLWLVTSCTPNCAQAPRHKYAAKLTASDIVYCGRRPVYDSVVAVYGDDKTLRGASVVC
jgi:hypothetical protein